MVYVVQSNQTFALMVAELALRRRRRHSREPSGRATRPMDRTAWQTSNEAVNKVISANQRALSLAKEEGVLGDIEASASPFQLAPSVGCVATRERVGGRSRQCQRHLAPRLMLVR